MSWWVKEHIAVNDSETQQLCSIEADNQTSLPAADQTATAGFIIVRGSDAKDVDTGDKYIMDSTGAWKLQPSGVQLDLSGYATTQDLTDGLAAKVDTSTYTSGQAAQDAQIAYSINAGAKNHLNVTAQSTGIVTVNADGTLTVNGSSTSNTSVTLSSLWLKKGTYRLSSGVQLPTGVYLSIRIAAGGQIIQVRDTVTDVEFDVPVDMGIDRIWLFVNANTPVDNLTIYPMIRLAEITDSTYMPYAPTNRELYEMILALQ